MDLTGETFGGLTVLGVADHTPSGKIWLCECNCGSGERVLKYTTQLRRKSKKGVPANPGCSQCETQRRSEVHRTHGGKGSALYVIWKGMRSRCRDKGNTSFAHYGGKGIRVSAVWDDFEVFRVWAESNGWKDEDVPAAQRMSIDRIDPAKDYSPENCRWITRSENSLRVH